MIVIHGTYTLARRIVAYRNDYCLSCGTQRVALCDRSFYVLHISFIPILPLGFWKKWRCSVCGQDPHERVGTRKAYKWAGTALLGFMSLAMWFAPIERGEEAMMWGMRIVLPIAFAFALRATLRSGPDVNLSEKLREVVPISDPYCPFCKTSLVSVPDWHCPNCKVRRMVIGGA
jgi:hypothetical protein